MTWTAVPLTATCDLADPGWEGASAPTPACDLPDPGWSSAEAPGSACDLEASVAYLFEAHDSSIEDGYEGTAAGWTIVRMESVCDG